MFDSLTKRLGGVFDRLRKRGALGEADVAEAMREIRIALLEADVALPVVKSFVAKVKERAVGQEVIKSVTPGQMVVKIVHDQLVELLGGSSAALELGGPPGIVLMVGLQGSGKTTTSGKLALRLKDKDKKRVLLASLDVQRPAAQHQLEVLAGQAGVASVAIVPGESPLAITRRALEQARREGYDTLILDTAGRLHIDDTLMDELAQVRDLARPHETLLVADSLTGQDAVNVARHFAERIGITGIVLTRLDGDARGGAALSMREITGKPIKFVGTSEKLAGLDAFHPERMASRILEMGDVVSLVEKASELVDKDEAEKLARKMTKGRFDLNDLQSQLKQVGKMGGMGGILGMLPGVGKIKKQLAEANIDEKIILRQSAIIDSMTRLERRSPEIIAASRKRRIAAGAGASVQEVNRLLKQHRQMHDMMKRMKKAGGPKQFLGRHMPPGMMPR
ncbi:MAG: signal recognition particle protein [Geminicoccaceae bacterium]|nr:signal recognition particle protein [Geminicoccaceae bacterium]HRY26249.1 signal recognition particle protein [Geminicoccaceae bacterium]